MGAQPAKLGRFRLARYPRLSSGVADCAVALTSRLASRYIAGVLIDAARGCLPVSAGPTDENGRPGRSTSARHNERDDEMTSVKLGVHLPVAGRKGLTGGHRAGRGRGRADRAGLSVVLGAADAADRSDRDGRRRAARSWMRPRTSARSTTRSRRSPTSRPGPAGSPWAPACSTRCSRARVILARRLATLDRFSGGRLIAGVGQGWMEQEFAAAGVSMKRRGAGFEEHLLAMRAVWGPDPVHFEGRFYRIPEADIGPKPVRPGGPRLMVGAASPAALERAGRLGVGLTMVIFDWDTIRASIETFRAAAGAAGVDPTPCRSCSR